MHNARKAIVLLAGVAILAAVNVTIWSRERLLVDGRVVLLALAPVDPRSLMQGDYMALRFAIVDQALPLHTAAGRNDGRLVATLDAAGVASFTRLDNGAPLAADEVRLRYRVRNDLVKFATNAYFFEEGQAARFEAAKYGRFRVAADGEMLLTALCEADYRCIDAQQAPSP